MRAGSQGHHYFFMTGWSVRKANKMLVLAWNQRKQGGDPWGSMVLPLAQQILLPAPQNPLPLPSHLQPSAIQQPYIFQSERFWLQNLSGVNFTHSILVSPHIWKNTKILHGDIYSLWLAITFMRLVETFRKKICAWLHVLPLHQNHIYIDLPPLLLWSSLRCYIPGYSPHFAPNKT